MSLFFVLTKGITASGDENGTGLETAAEIEPWLLLRQRNTNEYVYLFSVGKRNVAAEH